MSQIVAGPWIKQGDEWVPPNLGEGTSIDATLDLADTEQQSQATEGSGLNNRGCGLWKVSGDNIVLPNGYEIMSADSDWSVPNMGALERSAWESMFNVTLPVDCDNIARAALHSLTVGSDPDGAGTRPLWPEKREDGYYLTVHFGGQKINRRFLRGDEHAISRWVPQIQSIIRSEFAVDPVQCGKWLGWLCNEITRDTGSYPNLSVLVPADLLANGLQPLQPSTTVTDDFSSDSGLWSLTTRGTFAIAAGVMSCVDVSTWPCATHTTTFSGSNHTAYATLSHTGASGLGVWVRRTTNTGQNEGYLHYWSPASLYRIARFVGGSATIVASTSVTAANGDVLKGDSNGSTHTVYQNGTQRAQGTDTTYPTGSLIGLGGQSGTRTYDNFNGTDGVASAVASMLLLLGAG